MATWQDYSRAARKALDGAQSSGGRGLSPLGPILLCPTQFSEDIWQWQCLALFFLW
jgi:hypothetical protein